MGTSKTNWRTCNLHRRKKVFQSYFKAGIRGVEVGTILADRDPETRENRYPKLELFRLAIPRRTYTKNHIDYIAVALRNVYNRRYEIKRGYKIIHEVPIMRHFTVKLEKLDGKSNCSNVVALSA